MKLLLITLLLSIGTFCPYFFLNIFGQEPSYVQYNIENGAPSNEIYTLLQDHKGYIWIGSDAGVYRFNGIHYEYFYSSDLRARSATGLIQSQSGKIYGYNFAGQIFYIDQDTLHVLKSWKGPVNGLATDKNGKVWISSQKGSYYIDDNTLHLTRHKSDLLKYDNKTGDSFTSCIRRDSIGNIYYQNATSIIERDQSGNEISTNIHPSFEVSPILISSSINDPWLFSKTELLVFRKLNGKWIKYTDQRLLDLLKGRKPNTVTEIDGHLWINTHTGVIHFNLETGDSELFYPSIAFSGCMKDREGNYWFSSLHHGLLKMPSIGIRTWNRNSSLGEVEQLSHLIVTNNEIAAATTGGDILSVNLKTKKSSILKHDLQSDFGMLYFDSIDDCIYFNKLSYLFELNKNNVERVNQAARSIKSMLHIKDGYLLLSSQGLYFVKKINDELTQENQLAEGWFRDVCSSQSGNEYFLASNDGLIVLRREKDNWKFDSTILPEKQVISVACGFEQESVFFLTFDGEIHRIDKNGARTLVEASSGSLRPIQLKVYKNHLYLATANGLLEINLSNGLKKMINTYNGLPSNNIRQIVLRNDTCWAASGKGLISIPLNLFHKKNVAGYLHQKDVYVNNKSITLSNNHVLQYNDLLTLIVDGLTFSSNGNFQLAYKINGHTNGWIYVPGSSGKLEIPRLPSGNINIEVKMVNHNGMDSINILQYTFKVIPPYWQRWWFYLIIIAAIGGLSYLFFLWRLKTIRRKQHIALQQLTLENELRLTQQNALKAQMNPHFLFNVLNSIKAYIYDNDKRNASRYLSDFSSLVRKVLDLSSQSRVSLEKELEALKIYMELEAMLLQSDFESQIIVDDNVDTYSLQIPALIIQPYVENSIKHGLRHQIGKKVLTVRVSYLENENTLKISIDDNGIGRKASAQINLDKEYESFASQAIEKRITLLNHENEGLVGVEIIDKFDGNETSSGTTVNIRIHV